jgi:hypothetical protein
MTAFNCVFSFNTTPAGAAWIAGLIGVMSCRAGR